MIRDLTKGNKINNWIVISDKYMNDKNREAIDLRCSCGKETSRTIACINRSNFAKHCRSCSQQKRRITDRKVFVGEIVKGLKILKVRPATFSTDTRYDVECVHCGHKYTKGPATILKKKTDKCIYCITSADKSKKKRRMLSKDISLFMFNRIKNQAKLRGIEFNLTSEYLQTLLDNQKFLCGLSGLPLILNTALQTKEDRKINTASLDRKDSDLGYIVGNVMWVHKKVNYMKHSLSIVDFLNLCKSIVYYANPERSLTSE